MSSTTDSRRRDEIDRAVMDMDWDAPGATDPGSAQRMRVAAVVDGSDLVEARLARQFPDPGQRQMMVEYTKPRIIEKITCLPTVSNARAWNRDGLWDPTAGRSLCGWVRQTAYIVARTNAGRVLHPRALPASHWQGEDSDFNPVTDDKGSVSLTLTSDFFADHPGLKVPRPAGRSRDRLLALMPSGLDDPASDGEARALLEEAKGAGGAAARRLRGRAHAVMSGIVERYRPRIEEVAPRVCEKARDMGLWDPSLDALQPHEVVSLMLSPLTSAQARVFAGLDPSPLFALYARSQLKRPPRRLDWAALRRGVSARAESDGVPQWGVWLRLGTLAARMASGD